jgi:hypothetical protein
VHSLCTVHLQCFSASIAAASWWWCYLQQHIPTAATCSARLAASELAHLPAAAAAAAAAASYAHGSYLRKHSVGHSLGIAASLLAEADKLMASKRVRGGAAAWAMAGQWRRQLSLAVCLCCTRQLQAESVTSAVRAN